jgi:hypothetical protein
MLEQRKANPRRSQRRPDVKELEFARVFDIAIEPPAGQREA